MKIRKTNALILFFLIYPQSVTPAIQAEVSVGRFFSIAVKLPVYCSITRDGWAGGTSNYEATTSALSACGAGCVSVVTFKTVQ